MIKIRSALLADFDKIRVDPVHSHFVKDTLMFDGIRVYMASRSIMTADYNGAPVFMADSRTYKDGMYVWALVDCHEFPKHYIDVVRKVKRWMRALINTNVYAHVKRGHDGGSRLLMFLGFDLAQAHHLEHKGATFDLYIKRAA